MASAKGWRTANLLDVLSLLFLFKLHLYDYELLLFLLFFHLDCCMSPLQFGLALAWACSCLVQAVES